MNVTALGKLEKAWIRFEWQEWLNKSNTMVSDLISIVDTIDVFKGNKKTKELVIAKYRIPVSAYVIVRRENYSELLERIKDKMLEYEEYEECAHINEIIKYLKK